MKPYKTAMKRILARNLTIHPVAQREVVPSKLAQMKKDFDLDAVGVVHVIEVTHPKTGVISHPVIDGQHRVLALQQLELGDWPVDCQVHLNVADDAAACRIFLRLNDRAAVNSYDKFVAEVRAGNAAAVGSQQIAFKHGWQLSRQSTDGSLCCVSMLKQIYPLDAGVTLDAALEIVGAAWGKKASSGEARILNGLAIIIRRYGAELDHPSLIKSLAKFPGGASALIGAARGLQNVRRISVGRCVAEVMLEIYNSGKRSQKLDPL